jgi:hypothetical protein
MNGNEMTDPRPTLPGGADGAALQRDDYPAPRPADERVVPEAGGGLLDRLPETAELRSRVEAGIRERPLLSIGVGLLAGFLLGRALRD